MQDIFRQITSSFGALWKCRPRGESIEVITPFPTSTDMYVSVFVTKRGDAWIATDGGWMCKEVYNCCLPLDEKIYSKVFDFFVDDFGIKSTTSASGDTFYYKGTRDRRLVPNIVFELATFISQTVSVALVQFREQTEQERFSTQVKTFLRSRLNDERLKFNTSFSKEFQGARFNAVISSPRGRFSLINFASGRSAANIKSSIARASFNLDYIDFSPEAHKVENRIVLIDDEQLPFDSPQIENAVALCRNKNQQPVSWIHGKTDLIEKVIA